MRPNCFKIKTAVAVLIATLFLFNSCAILNGKKEQIRVVDFTFTLPLINQEGEVDNVRDTVRILQAGNDLVYQLSTFSLRYKNRKLIHYHKNFEYYLLRKDDSVGTFYDTLLKPHKDWIPADSALKKRVFYNQNIGEMRDSTLLGQAKNVEGFDLIETYGVQDQQGNEHDDTTYLYYKASLDGFHPTFSKKQDDKNTMKLSKVRVVYLPKSYEGIPGIVARREFIFEMKEVEVFDEKKVRNLLRKLRKNRLK